MRGSQRVTETHREKERERTRDKEGRGAWDRRRNAERDYESITQTHTVRERGLEREEGRGLGQRQRVRGDGCGTNKRRYSGTKMATSVLPVYKYSHSVRVALTVRGSSTRKHEGRGNPYTGKWLPFCPRYQGLTSFNPKR